MKNTGIVQIRGKEYQTVAYRVSKFREEHPDYSLTTNILFRNEECVVIQAVIANNEGRVLASGHAEEFRESSSINKTSALENSETSAIGRALAALGYGGTEFCSADELVNAINNKQEAPKSKITPAAGVYDSFSDEEKEFIDSIAAKVLDAIKISADNAFQLLEDSHLQTEEKIAVWDKLDSKTRSAIKRVGEKRKANKIAQETLSELASQA